MDAFSSWSVSAAISKTSTFGSLAEAVSTFVITLIAAIFLLIMFFHTGYKFYIEDISRDLEDDLPSTLRSRSRKSSAPKSRAKMPRLSNQSASSSFRHDKEIHQAIALFTVLYLFSGASYTLIQCIIRLITIFFGADVSCYINEYLQLLVALTRSMLYSLFLSRLHLTFSGSYLAYSSITLSVLAVLIYIFNFAAVTYYIIDTTNQIDSHNNKCSSENRIDYTSAFAVTVGVDTFINLVLLYLFVHKLSQLIRTLTCSMDSTAEIRRVKELIKLMTKLTVLASVAVVSSWITSVVFIKPAPHMVTMLDAIIGTICILLCYEFHKSKYMSYCFLCRQCCYHVCFWWFISEDWICTKNTADDAKKDGFEGGCYSVLCVCCQFDSNDDQDLELDNNAQELHVRDHTGTSNQDTTKTADQDADDGDIGKGALVKAPDVPAITIGDTVSKDSNNLEVSGTGADNKGKEFAKQILKSPTEEIVKTHTDEFQGTGSIRTPTEKNNFAFSHRAYTLKKIQHLLYEDEGVESHFRDLRLTFRASKKVHALRSMLSIEEDMDLDEQQKMEQQQNKNAAADEKQAEQQPEAHSAKISDATDGNANNVQNEKDNMEAASEQDQNVNETEKSPEVTVAEPAQKSDDEQYHD